MPVNRIEFARIHSLEEFYCQLAEQATLPAHFGYTLDALYDVLTSELEGPLEIVWHKHDTSATQMGYDNYTRLLAVLRMAADERPDIKLSLE